MGSKRCTIALLLVASVVGHQLNTALAHTSSSPQAKHTLLGRSLLQTEEQELISQTLETGASTAETFADVVSGLAEGADAASKAVQAAQKIASFASYASTALGFVGPIVSLAFAFAGGDSATDALIKEKFNEVNLKLDRLLADQATLREDIAKDIYYSVANSDWNSLAQRPRAVSTRLNEMLRNPSDPATRQNLKVRCEEEDPFGVLSEYHSVVMCKSGVKCLPQLMVATAEYEMAPFFDQARVIMRDVGLAQEMSLVCASTEGLQQSTIDDRRSQQAVLTKEIAAKLQETFESLHTDFWETAISKHIREPFATPSDEETMAKSIWETLSSKYPHMWWEVAVYTGRGSDTHYHWGCDLVGNKMPLDCLRTGAGVLFDFGVWDSGKNVIVAYRSRRQASVDDPLARYNEVMDSTCGGKANVQELATCLKDFALGVSVVRFGNGLRGYGSNQGSTGIVVMSGSAEKASVSEGEATILMNVASSSTVNQWSDSATITFSTPSPSPSPSPSPALSPSPSPSPSLSPPASFPCISGGDLVGTSLGVATVGSQAECEAACAADASCTSYTYLTDGRCATKSALLTGADGSFEMDPNSYVATCVRPDVVSASATNVVCVTGYDFMGTDLELLSGGDSAACQQACFANAACSFFLFTTSGVCAVKGDFLQGGDGTNGPNSIIEIACLRTIEATA